MAIGTRHARCVLRTVRDGSPGSEKRHAQRAITLYVSPNHLVAASLVLLAAACAPRPYPKLVQQPITNERTWVSELVPRSPARREDLGSARAAVRGRGRASERDHGRRLRDARRGCTTTPTTTAYCTVRAIGAAGKRPALAFEMMEEDDQPAIDGAVARAPRDPDAIAGAVDWKHSGWYDFMMADLRGRARRRACRSSGRTCRSRSLRRTSRSRAQTRFTPGPPRDTPAVRAAPRRVRDLLRAEMKAAHCDADAEKILDRLALAQRARDAQMARRARRRGGRRRDPRHGQRPRATTAASPRRSRERAPASAPSRSAPEVSPGKVEPLYAAEFERDRCRSTSSSSLR